MTKVITATIEIDLEEYDGADVWEDGLKRWYVSRVGTSDLPSEDEILSEEDLWLYGSVE